MFYLTPPISNLCKLNNLLNNLRKFPCLRIIYPSSCVPPDYLRDQFVGLEELDVVSDSLFYAAIFQEVLVTGAWNPQD